MRHCVAIFILIFSLNHSGTSQINNLKISKRTAKAVSKIEKINELMSSAVYNAGIRPEQYDNFLELQNKATTDELITLTNHSNGVVRCYAFWALSEDSSANLLPIIIQHINDNELVKTQFGCIGSREKVGDFFASMATLSYYESGYLDSLLIYAPNSLQAREYAIERARPTEHLYARVRELVIEENNQTALVALAKFQKEEDIRLILKYKDKNDRYNRRFFTYRAISEFPHPAFVGMLTSSLYESLEDDHWSTEWRELYKAIASYKNDTALALLKIPFSLVKHQQMREYHIDFVFQAVREFYSPIYDSLLWEMWANENKITTDVFKLLYQKNQMKALYLTKKTIENASSYNLTAKPYNVNGEDSMTLLDIMLDSIVVQDRPSAIALINKNLLEGDVIQFSDFADNVLKLKDISLITSLVTRLEKEDNPHVYLKATETLISFNDKRINHQILEVSKRNANLRAGWGGKSF